MNWLQSPSANTKRCEVINPGPPLSCEPVARRHAVINWGTDNEWTITGQWDLSLGCTHVDICTYNKIFDHQI